MQEASIVSRPSLRRLINATGVIIHTNLGRAPLARVPVEAITSVASHYSNLEYDLVTGERGKRESHCQELLARLAGGEAAIVTNNNAAALVLVLNTLALGGRGNRITRRASRNRREFPDSRRDGKEWHAAS